MAIKVLMVVKVNAVIQLWLLLLFYVKIQIFTIVCQRWVIFRISG